MKVIRDGQEYDVIDYLPDTGEVCVEVETDFYYPPYKRKIKCWWDKGIVYVMQKLLSNK